MTVLNGFPFFRAEFAKDASRVNPAEVQGAVDAVRAGAITDLVVVSHGWNNNMDEAKDLYQRLFGHFRTVAGIRPELMAGKQVAVLGVFWPSKKFDDGAVIAGGAASAGTEAEAELVAQLGELKGAFDAPDADAKLDRAIELVPALEFGPAARREFADLLRSLHAGTGDDEDRDTVVRNAYSTANGSDLIEELGEGAVPPEGPREDGGEDSLGGAAGGLEIGGAASEDEGEAATLGGLIGGVVGGARMLANLTTFYQMKERAGVIGQRELAPLLRELRGAAPGLRIHLAGHSFGARLVSAAAAGTPGDAALPISSMTLLQAAFSHDGFAAAHEDRGEGFFRGVVTGGKVAGPVLVTHTRNDRAVGIAYAIASRLARQQAMAVGGPGDPYGGLGGNGAQHTPEAVQLTLLDAGGAYPFRPGQFHNLKSDKLISGHGDVASPATAWALLNAMAVA